MACPEPRQPTTLETTAGPLLPSRIDARPSDDARQGPLVAPPEIARPHRDVAVRLIGAARASSEIPVRLAVELPDADDDMVGTAAAGLGIAFGLLRRAVTADIDVVPLRRAAAVVRVDGLMAKGAMAVAGSQRLKCRQRPQTCDRPLLPVIPFASRLVCPPARQ